MPSGGAPTSRGATLEGAPRALCLLLSPWSQPSCFYFGATSSRFRVHRDASAWPELLYCRYCPTVGSCVSCAASDGTLSVC
mmetsp:Transcript_3990/g.10374  ORF Transcript_3990/g.10374 Transcript_3990/m.10374 type:complete len:81 (-) Transcript_3990:245-487(-)